MATPFVNGVDGRREAVPLEQLQEWRIIETHRQRLASNDYGVHAVLELLYHWINRGSNPLAPGYEFIEYGEDAGCRSRLYARRAIG